MDSYRDTIIAEQLSHSCDDKFAAKITGKTNLFAFCI